MQAGHTFTVPQKLTRRRFIGNAVTLATASTLPGCCLRRGTDTLHAVGLPPSALGTSLDLVIDSHAHIFNGSDLPVKEFISRIVLGQKGIPDAMKQVAGDLVRLIASPAPCGYQELAYLKKLSDRASSSNPDLVFQAASQAAYKRTKRAVSKAIAQMKAPMTASTRRPQLAPAPPISQAQIAASANATPAMQAILQTPEPTYEQYVKLIQETFAPASLDQHANLQARNFNASKLYAATSHPLLAQPRAATPCNVRPPADFKMLGLCNLLLTNDLYRITEIQKYLSTFTGANAANRNVDLVLAHMVDYDWWLTAGQATPTSLQTQIDVMAEISIYTKGQVHAFAPFDPLREIAFRSGHIAPKGNSYSSLTLIQDAVRTRGCIGVKLYPPMGFAPGGNASVEEASPTFWNQPPNILPAWVTGGPIAFSDGIKESFGAKLDQVLDELFCWCAKEEVPVMAHSSTSNGPNQDFEDLATAQYWAPVLTKYKNLRVTFGHLGHFTAFPQNNTIPCSSAALISLFGSENHAYGDAAFDSEIMSDNGLERVEERFALGMAQPLFASRMMYGTDWNLLQVTGDIHDYQRRFQALAEGLSNANQVVDGHLVKDRLLGWNAVDYLGLRKGDSARSRLEAFYAANGLNIATQKPEWMRKVDCEVRTT